MTDHAVIEAADGQEAPPPDASEMADLLISVLSDGLDHPELWPQIGEILDYLPDLSTELGKRLDREWHPGVRTGLTVLLILCYAARGQIDFALEQLEQLSIMFSQSPLVQGGIFYLHSLKDKENPCYQLEGKICTAPFEQLDVLERTTHLCCASWLLTSAGNLATTDWGDVWNSETAQAIRASIHDGSYRYCNKMACPKIRANDLVPAEQIAATSDLWAQIIAERATELPVGPKLVNLAYDRTCNLSCPSCRTEKWAADEATRTAYDEMQRTRILPLLKGAQTVFVTGSGDPFASKNFRRLMLELTAEEYPELRFQIMTNGMLFTPRQWGSFPTLHGRTAILKISIDAAEGATHELLRRGARWPVMLENMAFAGELTRQGLIGHYDLVFTVQQENFREMGDAVDLARRVGASGIYFARITNWGTFTDAEFARKAVFLPSHPDYAEFLQQMADPRLRDPMVLLGDLHEFIKDPIEGHRSFTH